MPITWDDIDETWDTIADLEASFDTIDEMEAYMRHATPSRSGAEKASDDA